MFLNTNQSICPRCSRQVPGILCSEDSGYFISCLCCGYVVLDRGYRPTGFKELLTKGRLAEEKLRAERIAQSVR